MKNRHLNPRILVIILIILLAAFSRLIPHLPNFTPIGAIALFGGTYFLNKKLAFLIPFLAMLFSDMLIGFHSAMFAVYLSFFAIVGIGMLLKENVKPVSLLFATISSSILFFIVTNFAVWIGSTVYPQDFGGLISCFVAAIPFFHYTALGDLFYVGVLFGSFYLYDLKFPVLSKVKSK